MGFLNSLFSDTPGSSLEKKLAHAIDKVEATLNTTVDRVEQGAKKLENAGATIEKASAKMTKTIDAVDDASKKAVKD